MKKPKTCWIYISTASCPPSPPPPLAKHLLRCPACATEMRTLETTRELLRQSVPPEIPTSEYHDRTLARLQAAFFANVRQSSLPDTSRQWTLPFAREDREAG